MQSHMATPKPSTLLCILSISFFSLTRAIWLFPGWEFHPLHFADLTQVANITNIGAFTWNLYFQKCFNEFLSYLTDFQVPLVTSYLCQFCGLFTLQCCCSFSFFFCIIPPGYIFPFPFSWHL